MICAFINILYIYLWTMYGLHCRILLESRIHTQIQLNRAAHAIVMDKVIMLMLMGQFKIRHCMLIVHMVVIYSISNRQDDFSILNVYCIFLTEFESLNITYSWSQRYGESLEKQVMLLLIWLRMIFTKFGIKLFVLVVDFHDEDGKDRVECVAPQVEQREVKQKIPILNLFILFYLILNYCKEFPNM